MPDTPGPAPRQVVGAGRSAAVGTLFNYRAGDPERYGVLGFDAEGRVSMIIEKQTTSSSNYAVTGLHFLDATAPESARRLRPSARGKLEVADPLRSYLAEGTLEVELLGRGHAWLDTGTHESLLDAESLVRTL